MRDEIQIYNIGDIVSRVGHNEIIGTVVEIEFKFNQFLKKEIFHYHVIWDNNIDIFRDFYCGELILVHYKDFEERIQERMK